MSFSSSSAPRDSESEHVLRRKGEKTTQEEPAALDLLDDYWFFSNPLGGRDGAKGRAATTRPPLLPKSPSTSSAGAGSPGGRKAKADACRRLLRTPSLPSPRIGLEQPSPSSPKDEELAEDDAGDRREAEVEEDDEMNWSKIYEGVLRTRIAEEGRRSSALNRAPSMPLTSSATMGGRRPAGLGESTPSMPRLRHSHSTLDRHYRPHTPTKLQHDRTPRMTGGGGGRAERGPPRRDLRSFSANQQPALVRDKSGLNDKMWKSSSALESIEVQGFKDLGFVFDQEELRESLADVLPGLRDDKTTTKPPHKSSASVSGSISGSASDNDDPNAADSSNGTGIGIGASNAVGNDGVVQRPYLSEAWQHGARSAPPTAAAAIRLQQADARSAAEMKDQIRMWAQAVACNVRQEC